MCVIYQTMFDSNYQLLNSIVFHGESKSIILKSFYIIKTKAISIIMQYKQNPGWFTFHKFGIR
ncbi:Uncharacterised protein [Klebsiella pneumoniae]|nr:Uncharacterised protein [Klebsiella pneumoniae]